MDGWRQEVYADVSMRFNLTIFFSRWLSEARHNLKIKISVSRVITLISLGQNSYTIMSEYTGLWSLLKLPLS